MLGGLLRSKTTAAVRHLSGHPGNSWSWHLDCRPAAAFTARVIQEGESSGYRVM